MIGHVTGRNFETEVTQHQGTVIVDFYAPWCAPCKALAPILDEFDAEMGSEVKVMKVNIDENPELASQFGVMSIPTLVRFVDGVRVHQVIGIQSKEQLKRWAKAN